MVKGNEDSNAQNWELEIVCRNKKYLDAVITAVLKYGMLNFEVKVIDYNLNHDCYDGRYLVLIWCSWFNNLTNLSIDLSEIEKKLN